MAEVRYGFLKKSHVALTQVFCHNVSSIKVCAGSRGYFFCFSLSSKVDGNSFKKSCTLGIRRSLNNQLNSKIPLVFSPLATVEMFT